MTDPDQHEPLPKGEPAGEDNPVGAADGANGFAAWRTAVTTSPAVPFEALYPTDAWQRDSQQAADGTLSGTWKDMHFPPLDLRPPVAWDTLASGDRIRDFRLHSWHALGPVLAAFERTEDAQYLNFAVALATDWVASYDAGHMQSPFAWYPMAVGARAHRLAYILDRAIRSERFADAELAILQQSLERHVSALSDDTTFPAHSNQGVFIAASQASVARRFLAVAGMEDVRDQSHQRLVALLDEQFTPEGVHREHSPEYHLRALRTFEELVQAGLLDDEGAVARCHLAADTLSWFVLPNGRLATFGDTSHVDTAGLRGTETQEDASGTSHDSPQDRTAMHAFTASGYVVIRGYDRTGGDVQPTSYLAQTCAFHSRVHKHADDLSVIWYDRGHELLIDPGKYGYFGQTETDSDLAREGFWYSDPNRIYVESTCAHNTVEIDGKSYERREVEPYGSALGRVGVTDGIAFAESEVRHFSSIEHVRVFVFNPGAWLLFLDLLVDHENLPHAFAQRFHFAPELALLPADAQPCFAVPQSTTPLRLVSLLEARPFVLVAGQREPEMLGWISRREGEIAPCWSATTALADVRRATFATLLTFSDDTVITSSPHWTSSKVTADGHRALLRWQQDDRVHTVQIDRPPAEPFGMTHRSVQARD